MACIGQPLLTPPLHSRPHAMKDHETLQEEEILVVHKHSIVTTHDAEEDAEKNEDDAEEDEAEEDEAEDEDGEEDDEDDEDYEDDDDEEDEDYEDEESYPRRGLVAVEESEEAWKWAPEDKVELVMRGLDTMQPLPDEDELEHEWEHLDAEEVAEKLADHYNAMRRPGLIPFKDAPVEPPTGLTRAQRVRCWCNAAVCVACVCVLYALHIAATSDW